jgi:Family of unknown function (DUF5335)
MRNRQVPRSEWFNFFQEFTRRHDGWLVTVRVLDPRFGSQVEARDMPLEGIVSAADASGPISIHVGSSLERHLEHEIAEPKQVWVELSEEGAEEALEIESGEGTRTILQFRAAGLPETVDGILHR